MAERVAGNKVVSPTGESRDLKQSEQKKLENDYAKIHKQGVGLPENKEVYVVKNSKETKHESLWTIARDIVKAQTEKDPTNKEIGTVWAQICKWNKPLHKNLNLIHEGDFVFGPPMPAKKDGADKPRVGSDDAAPEAPAAGGEQREQPGPALASTEPKGSSPEQPVEANVVTIDKSRLETNEDQEYAKLRSDLKVSNADKEGILKNYFNRMPKQSRLLAASKIVEDRVFSGPPITQEPDLGVIVAAARQVLTREGGDLPEDWLWSQRKSRQ